MTIGVGARLGHYEVLARIGAGGMGVVYRARDTVLGRDVALKLLPPASVTDPERRSRFGREARVLASLNHPNIAAIHGVIEAGTTRALVLELVEGPTLAARLRRGSMAVDEALAIARQILAALEAAHRQGVIHRDLKPANITIGDDGLVKVLDFGLAKLVGPTPTGAVGDGEQGPSEGSPASDDAGITTMTALTERGILLGTPTYMSPEQALGRTVDRRADIWSFGTVLFEMLTGAPPFSGEDAPSILAAIVTSEPDFARLPPGCPRGVEPTVRRCLAKEPRERPRDAGDVALALDGAFTTPPAATGTRRHARSPASWLAPLVTGLLAGAVTTLLVMDGSDPRVGGGARTFTATTPGAGPYVPSGYESNLAVSPDGSHFVYRSSVDGVNSIRVRSIHELADRELFRTIYFASTPFISPDGAWVGFRTSEDGTLKKVALAGGSPLTVCPVPDVPRGATWLPDDTIVFATAESGAGLRRVSAAGGTPEALTTPDHDEGETAHWWPDMLPEGRGVLFTIVRGADPARMQIAVLDLESGQHRVVVPVGTRPRYALSGHLLYGVGQSVWAVPFDLDRLDVAGRATRVVDGVLGVRSGNVEFDVADSGTLVYATAMEPRAQRLVWVDRAGRAEPLSPSLPPGRYVYPRVSPAGDRILVADAEFPGGDGETDLWVIDPARGSRIRVTFGGNNQYFPTWLPDGGRVAFSDANGPTNRILVAPAGGSGVPEVLVDRFDRQFPNSWAPDGQTLAFHVIHPETHRDLWTLEMEDDQGAVPFLVTPFQERAAVFSPDGRWIAYVSDESGRNEVYVRPYPAASGPRHAISTGGGNEPVWAPDGRTLFYRAGNWMMAVDIRGDGVFRAGVPEPLFEGYARDPAGNVVGMPNFDITPDGRRFIMVETPPEAGRAPGSQLIVMLDWDDGVSGNARR